MRIREAHMKFEEKCTGKRTREMHLKLIGSALFN